MDIDHQFLGVSFTPFARNSLTSMANEVILMIAKNLEVTDLNSLNRTNRGFYYLTARLLKSKSTDTELETRYINSLSIGYPICLRALIRRGADVNRVWESAPCSLDPERTHIESALSYAVQGGNIKIVGILLEYRVSSQEHNDYWSLVMMAVKDNNYLMVRLLLNNGYTPNSLMPAIGGPLFLAALNRRRDILILLLFYGANPHVRDLDGRRPVDIPYSWRQKALLRERERRRRIERGFIGLPEAIEGPSYDAKNYWPNWEKEELADEARERQLGDDIPLDLKESPSLLRLLLVVMKHWKTDALRGYLQSRVIRDIKFQKALEKKNRKLSQPKKLKSISDSTDHDCDHDDHLIF